MRLYEFDASDLQVKLAASTNQLTNDIEIGNEKPDWTVPELLEYYRDNDIIIDKSDLFDLIKEPPLKNYISNIRGNEVIFKGQESDDEDMDQGPEEHEKVVQQMAKSAMK